MNTDALTSPPSLQIEPPPPGRFAIGGLVSVAELELFAGPIAELRRLNGIVAEYHFTAVVRREQEARAKCDQNPTQENVEAWEKALEQRDALRANPLTNNKLRGQAQRMVWRYFAAEIQPFLVDVAERARGAIYLELEDQLAREKTWLAAVEVFNPWFARYGLQFEFGRLPSAILGRRLVEMDARMAKLSAYGPGAGDIPENPLTLIGDLIANPIPADF